jgi:hypothetical protein
VLQFFGLPGDDRSEFIRVLQVRARDAQVRLWGVDKILHDANRVVLGRFAIFRRGSSFEGSAVFLVLQAGEYDFVPLT